MALRTYRPRRSRLFGPLRLLAVALAMAAIAACERQHQLLDDIVEAQCAISPTAIDFGSVAVGDSADRTFTARNDGGEALSGSVSEACGDFALVGQTDFALGSGESKVFTLRFRPSGAGPQTCSVSIAGCGTLPTSGQGFSASPACGVAPTTLDFGTVTVGTSADRSFTVTNTGGTNLSGTVQEACPAFSLVGSGNYDLAPTEQATFTVRFTPTSAGLQSCTLDSGGLCADVSASGTGQTPPPGPLCQVSTTSLSFGTVTTGQSATRTFSIQNVGGGTLSGTVSESCAEFSIVGSPTYSLDANESATFTVRFAPTTSGAKNCTIDTGTGCTDVSASGTGQTPPACEVSVTSLSFGTVTVGQSATRTFSIENVGQGTLSGSVSESCLEFSIVGSSTYSLGAGQSATFTVSFAPATGGAKNCTIDTGALCADVTAAGTGELALPICQLSATTLAFGDASIGTTVDRQLVITNIGLGTLSGTLTESCPEFSIVGTASYSLAPLEAATFTLRFAPTVLGDFTCTLEAGATCGSVSLSGRGVPVPVCELSATSYDFGEVDVGKHEDRNFDVRNVGGGQLCGTPSEDCEGFEILSAPTYCAVPGTPYRLKVRFLPTRVGPFECTVNPGSGCPAITVRGVGK